MNLFEYIEKCAKHYRDFVEDITDLSYNGISEYTFWRMAALNTEAEKNDIHHPVVDGSSPADISKLTINSPRNRGQFKWYSIVFQKNIIIVQNYSTEIIKLDYDDLSKDATEIVLIHGLTARDVLFTNF